VALFFLIGLIWLFHNGRTYKETINGTKKIRWGRVWVGVWSWGAIMAITSFVDVLINPENFVFQFDAARFIPLVFIALLLIPLQTTLEELTFRGYFAQGLAGLTRSRWVAFLVPSIVFGLLHQGNPEVAEYGFWEVMPKYIIGGLVYGLISTLDDGIELAIGAHAIHNIFLCLFFTFPASALPTYALFEIQEVNMGVKSILTSLTFSTIFVAFLSWKYKWDFSILNKRVEKTEEEVINATENEQNNPIRPQF
jgi:membrane protease YdiL (CAAX protease family)